MSRFAVHFFIFALVFQFYSGQNAQELCGVWSDNGNIPWSATLNTQSDIIPKTIVATIVNPSLVLVNANLFLSKGKNDNVIHLEDLPYFTVSANVSAFGETHADNDITQTVEVSSVVIHPLFNYNKSWTLAENDIAAVHLRHPLKFDSFVNAVCIPTEEIFNRIMERALGEQTIEDYRVILTGWNRSKPKLNLLYLDMQIHEFCQNWWENNNETSSAPYINRYCSYVSKDNSNDYCIHRDNGIFGKWDNQLYFLGFVSNFYSDKGICNSNTLYFGATPHNTILRFIKSNIKDVEQHN